MIYLSVLFLLSLLIVIHELGHLLAAKMAGIPIAGFSVGLGPKLWSRRLGPVEYSLRALPLGGFVTPALEEEAFTAVPLRKRLVFFLGGPLANLLSVLPALAALNAVRGQASAYDLLVAPFGQLIAACGQFLGMIPDLFREPQALQGVVGIVIQGGQAAAAGQGLEVAISLSLSLALLNLLPIPVLDGGQITLACLEALFPRAASLRAPLTVMGLFFLAGVMLYANGHDILRFWQQLG